MLKKKKTNHPPTNFIAHLIVDEKFIDIGIQQFELAAPGVHRVLLIGTRKALRYVKSNLVEFHSIKSATNIINSDTCAGVVFHSMQRLRFLTRIHWSKKVVWIGWGSDYYGNILDHVFPEGLLLEQTAAAFKERSPRPHYLIMLYENMKDYFKKVYYTKHALSRVDIFSPVLDIEHKMAAEKHPWFRAKYIQWNYGTVQDQISQDEAKSFDLGENILLGNSASFENNHIELFEWLYTNVALENKKIIVPLSYGDEWYRDKIIKVGTEKFGSQFHPLIDFLGTQEYIDLIQDCGYIFMNHLRQQAVGNICISMLMGGKVYLNPESVLYGWFKSHIAHVYPIDQINRTSGEGALQLTPLNHTEAQNNIKFIRSIWDSDIQNEKTKNLINIIITYCLRI